MIKKHWITLTLGVSISLIASWTHAGYREVWATVTSVEPVVEERRGPSKDPACRTPRPESASGLADLLAWDLRTCVPSIRLQTTHYRVGYEWGGRQYTSLSKTLPGHKIKLQVNLDPI